ncbi:MAG: glutamine synthetase family protein [Bacteroidales bacterium]|nr:glutamine synthetase family protein [Bacteroidales bacterium]MCF8332602.1 glutamine synthetase family protein [Bacteroidales bacterium]
MKKNIEMQPNPLVQYLNKPTSEFTKADLIKYIEDNDIEMVNFRYAAEDGRLKCLNFVINSKEHLDSILSTGERVDGSSLFSHIEAGESDLYVVPRFRTAFLNPFSDIPTLDILCSFFDASGKPYEGAPEHVLRKAHEVLQQKTGYHMEVMGELEYYVISEEEDLFEASDQRNYHEAEPFAKWGGFRREAMLAVAQCGGSIKYGHSEVGNFTQNGRVYEQNEIEFQPTPLEEAADQLLIAKWVIRELAYQYGVTVTFAPKITVGKAGSGLHIHTRLTKDGTNVMIEKGELSPIAKRAIAGFLELAPSLTAFGNTNPTSYLRLVPNQEAPTNICWGDRNRSVLVRVPLGWRESINMSAIANPLEKDEPVDFSERQTVEFRSPDGSADIYLLLAGLTVAARYGLEMEQGLEYAEKTYVDVDIFDKEHQHKLNQLDHLPASCIESAQKLEEQKTIYMTGNVFPESLLNTWIKQLKNFKDHNLRQEIEKDPNKILDLVNKYFHV